MFALWEGSACVGAEQGCDIAVAPPALWIRYLSGLLAAQQSQVPCWCSKLPRADGMPLVVQARTLAAGQDPRAGQHSASGEQLFARGLGLEELVQSRDKREVRTPRAARSQPPPSAPHDEASRRTNQKSLRGLVAYLILWPLHLSSLSCGLTVVCDSRIRRIAELSVFPGNGSPSFCFCHYGPGGH